MFLIFYNYKSRAESTGSYFYAFLLIAGIKKQKLIIDLKLIVDYIIIVY